MTNELFENAKSCFEDMHKSGELTDDELDISAGAGVTKDGVTVVMYKQEGCEDFVCVRCRGSKSECSCAVLYSHTCMSCQYCGDYYPDTGRPTSYRICNKSSMR